MYIDLEKESCRAGQCPLVLSREFVEKKGICFTGI